MSRPSTSWLKRLAAGQMLFGLLASCSDELSLNKDRFNFNGVVERTTVTGKTPGKGGGPTCGGVRAPYGTKGMGPRAKGDPQRAYRVGPGDDLRFNIFGEEGMDDFSARVDAEGYVQLPIIETVYVTGKTTREIQSDLKDAYSVEFNEPWVTVELANAESHPIYFLGEFRKPGVQYLEFATELIESLALANGLEEDAYLPGARLIRNSHVCTVNLSALLKDGDFTQNVWMQSGDILFAPAKEDMRVYVLGAVETPQAIAFGPDGRTLLQALSIAGGPDEAAAKLGELRIIRSLSPTTGELMLVDVAAVLRGDGLDFPLQPGDVIYVSRDGLGDWNQAVSTILPSLQLIGGILTPIALINSIL